MNMHLLDAGPEFFVFLYGSPLALVAVETLKSWHPLTTAGITATIADTSQARLGTMLTHPEPARTGVPTIATDTPTKLTPAFYIVPVRIPK